jgi:hypothetical protein
MRAHSFLAAFSYLPMEWLDRLAAH